MLPTIPWPPSHTGSGTYVDSYLDASTWEFVDIECPANFYYVMMESGMLYKFTVYDEEGNSKLNVEWVGNTGLELPDVSSVTGGKYASMIYDQETGPSAGRLLSGRRYRYPLRHRSH